MSSKNIYSHDNLFLDNNATKDYYQIIETAKKENRKKVHKNDSKFVYYESHHVLPKSIFPEFEQCDWNKVLLTAKEHLICHQLLPKMLDKGKPYYQMIRAYHNMAFRKTNDMLRYELTPDEYEELRIEFSKAQTILGKRPCKETTKTLIGLANKGRKPSTVAVTNSVRARLGKKRPTDAVHASASAQIGNTNVRGKSWWNDGKKNTMSFECPGEGWVKGRTEFTEEHRRKISLSQIGNDRRKGKTKKSRI